MWNRKQNKIYMVNGALKNDISLFRGEQGRVSPNDYIGLQEGYIGPDTRSYKEPSNQYAGCHFFLASCEPRYCPPDFLLYFLGIKTFVLLNFIQIIVNC